MNKCPMSPQIPTFMVTSGAIWGAFFAFSLLALIYHQHLEDGDNNMLLVLPLLLFIAGFAVQCWGSYLVFSEWTTWRDKPHLADNLVFGCNKATYLFSFSLLIIFWCLGPCLLFLVKLACWTHLNKLWTMIYYATPFLSGRLPPLLPLKFKRLGSTDFAGFFSRYLKWSMKLTSFISI